jgi:hypothetical protein
MFKIYFVPGAETPCPTRRGYRNFKTLQEAASGLKFVETGE